MRYVIALLMWGLSAGMSFAATEVFTFDNEQKEQQFRKLTEELRCPKCQNNSIADSNSMIALDLRQKVYELMQEGKNRDEIVDYMVARYGYFVTYNPPLTPLTVALWGMPFIAIAIGGWIIFARSKKRVRVSKNSQQDDTETLPEATRASFWVYVPGIVIALGITGAAYYQVGNYKKVADWNVAYQQAPELLDRALNANELPLNNEEMENLALGLRTRLQEDPQNIDGWVMLGRIGMVLGNATMATDAYGRAYRLSPEDDAVALGYAEVLTRSSDPSDNQEGNELLKKLIAKNRTNVKALSLFAFNAFEQERYPEAISAWQMMLKLLPENDQRRAIIERSVEQALMMLHEKKGVAAEK
ncbi:cytochrome c biogenesis protein CcmH [Providencia rustigianii]|uniref:Cytochrome c-type biogenesis protein n=1 Tax=Providencia rustigianii DSM 4541 TaxID=500637 RepID=D1P491_9GAMM|nr:cytochrome c biogenesis protein CcmH [Providencia rustigianii]EFB71717.1 cytochrome C-type biogenesis protein CcmH [Providencia rustigianii DSM 4541]SPY78395.1 Cytochrome c-type biogenesis protein CcmH precursor [Providencia rustigianii]SUC28043.1 Cytochrome c-type biogenesis protein CcmH precursor [Providencia rustigianii]